jgi:hypothetical protein
MSKDIARSKAVAFKPNDAQLAMMRAAAQRGDCCFTSSEGMKTAALRKIGQKLIEMGMAREILAKAGMPAWRQDAAAAKFFALKLTERGSNEIALIEDTRPREEAGGSIAAPEVEVKESALPSESDKDTTASHEKVSLNKITAPSDVISEGAMGNPPFQHAVLFTPSAAPRPGSKLAEVLALLGRERGASLDELIDATDWLPHTTRAALTGLRKRGYQIERSRQDRATRYRVGVSTIEPSAADRETLDASHVDEVDRSNATKATTESGGSTISVRASENLGSR